MQVYLWQFSKLLPTRLGRHMEGHGVLPVLYLSSWLLTSFGSDFPLFFSSRVLDVVLTGSYPHAVLKVHKSDKPMGSCTAATSHFRSSSWVARTYYRSLATCYTPACLYVLRKSSCTLLCSYARAFICTEDFLPCWLRPPPPKSV
jgi:hypothetical protein